MLIETTRQRKIIANLVCSRETAHSHIDAFARGAPTFEEGTELAGLSERPRTHHSTQSQVSYRAPVETPVRETSPAHPLRTCHLD